MATDLDYLRRLVIANKGYKHCEQTQADMDCTCHSCVKFYYDYALIHNLNVEPAPTSPFATITIEEI